MEPSPRLVTAFLAAKLSCTPVETKYGLQKYTGELWANPQTFCRELKTFRTSVTSLNDIEMAGKLLYMFLHRSPIVDLGGTSVDIFETNFLRPILHN